MELVEPIRKIEDIENIKHFLLRKNYRNYMLFCLGINCGLRISDLLQLRVYDVKNKDYLYLVEKKTNKRKKQSLPHETVALLQSYIKDKPDNEFLFKSRESENTPITRQQARNVLKEAAYACGIKQNIATHSLRKTFGYFFYKQFKDVALLQGIFNHSAPSITLDYIGINQEERDNAMQTFRGL